jgi:predicted deacylase
MMLKTLLMFSSLACAADLTVGTATAPAGQTATGFIQVPAGVDAALNIPVFVIHGAKPGPTLAVISGAHGTEYASIVAMEKLGQTLNAADLSGAVIVVPLINLASFAQKVPHLNPVDGKNMNRMYPGKPDGTQTERACWAISKQVIDRSDYLIDLHGGDLDENLRRYAYSPVTGKAALDTTVRSLALAFGLDHVIIQVNTAPAVPGATSVSRYALDLGKPSIIAEAGHAGTTDASDIDVLVRGCENVMRHLKMLPGDAPAALTVVWLRNLTTVKSAREGIFYPLALPEAYVAKGLIIGYITDYFGNKLEDVKSPINGVITYICSVPSMTKGGTVANIAEVSPEP